MFDHFSFLLENSNILLSRPSLRGSTPLDVAYSSLMENTELALALRYLRIKSIITIYILKEVCEKIQLFIKIFFCYNLLYFHD